MRHNKFGEIWKYWVGVGSHQELGGCGHTVGILFVDHVQRSLWLLHYELQL